MMQNTDSVLKDIGLAKNKLISLFLDSEELCQLLLNKSSVNESDKESLLYRQVFPYLYVNETQLESLTYLCIEIVPYLRSTTKTLKITILLFTDKENMRYSKTGYLGTRVDIGVDMIERLLRNSYEFGIGKMELDDVRYNFPNNGYYGKELVYYVPDFKIKKA